MRPHPRVARRTHRSPSLAAFVLALASSCGLSAALSEDALAAGMDPTPERLVLQPPGAPGTCQAIAANPEIAVGAHLKPNLLTCRPDNVAFRNMISELGFAIAPTAFHPARTTGLGGFALTLEATYTHVNADAFSTAVDGTKTQYWHQGTQGSVDPSTNQFSIVNNSPDSLIQIYSLKARKGLPFGLELTGALGYVANTTLWVGGADVRWALLEGFRTGVMGVLPDVSVGGGVRTLTGSSKLFLTTVGIDVELSKPFTLADSAVLTPYIGYQRLIIFGNSTVVDTTPTVDALKDCGYRGPDPVTGSPMCNNKLSDGSDRNGDFNNNVTFDAVRVHRHRGIIGVNYRYEVLYLAGQMLFDISAPDDENPGLNSARQWTMALEAGVFF